MERYTFALARWQMAIIDRIPSIPGNAMNFFRVKCPLHIFVIYHGQIQRIFLLHNFARAIFFLFLYFIRYCLF